MYRRYKLSEGYIAVLVIVHFLDHFDKVTLAGVIVESISEVLLADFSVPVGVYHLENSVYLVLSQVDTLVE